MVTTVYGKNIIFDDLFNLLDKPMWLKCNRYSNDITEVVDMNKNNIIMTYDIVHSAELHGVNIGNSVDYLSYLIDICNRHYNERANSISQKMSPMSEQQILSIIYGVPSSTITEYYSKTVKGRTGFYGKKYRSNFTMKDAAIAVVRKRQFLEYAHNPENGIYCTYAGCRAERLYNELCFTGLDFWELVDKIKSDRLCNLQFVNNVKRLCKEYNLKENVIMSELTRDTNCSLEDAIIKYVNRRNNNKNKKE